MSKQSDFIQTPDCLLTELRGMITDASEQVATGAPIHIKRKVDILVRY